MLLIALDMHEKQWF